jgi:hypothetical protein
MVYHSLGNNGHINLKFVGILLNLCRVKSGFLAQFCSKLLKRQLYRAGPFRPEHKPEGFDNQFQLKEG